MMQPVPSAGAGFSPLDVELGLLPNHRFTPRVEEVVARVGASLPFAEAADLLHGVGGVQVSEATQRRLTDAVRGWECGCGGRGDGARAHRAAGAARR
jgi:hypothetical protein